MARRRSVSMICLILLVFVFNAFLFSAESGLSLDQFNEKADELLCPRSLRNAHWGVAVFDITNDRVIYEENLCKSFMPASNMKLFSTAVALEKFGPDFTFDTKFYIDGKIENGVLKGDLIVRGMGDPSFSYRYAKKEDPLLKMDALVEEIIEATGIKGIEGKIIGDDNFFTDDAIELTWESEDLSFWYAVECGGLNFNENVVQFRVKGRAGTIPELKVKSDIGYIKFINKATSYKEQGNSFNYSRNFLNECELFGNMRPGAVDTDRVSVNNATMYYLTAFEYALKKKGVNLEKASIKDIDALPKYAQKIDYENLQHVFTYQSEPLSEIIRMTNKVSHNLYADALLRLLGKKIKGEGSFKAGAKVVKETMQDWGIDTFGFCMQDGSGLSRRNFITPQVMMGLLNHMYESKHHEIFMASLPVSGEDGTLENRFYRTECKGRIHAKTGYINKVRALSGYAEAKDGKPYVFSIVCNNYLTSTSYINRLQDKFCDLIIKLNIEEDTKKNEGN